MKQITVSVPDKHSAFFLQLMRELSFVQIVDQENSENSLSDEQKSAWRDVKEGAEEHELDEENKSETRPIESLLNGLD